MQWEDYISIDYRWDDFNRRFFQDEGLDSPVLRVFLMFKILLLNIVLGCVFTIICFKLRRFVGDCFHVLLCGMCDDCDCDYDGSYSSRSIRKQRRSKKIQKRYPTEEDVRCECGTFTLWWMMIKRFCSNKKLVKKFLTILFGMAVSFIVSSIVFLDPYRNSIVDPPTPIHSFSNHRLFTNNTPNRNRVFFVTPTVKSGLQVPRLIRMAQALYSKRDFVTWVIVSTDPVPGHLWFSYRTEHWSWSQMTRWKNNESRVLTHLEDLYETVARFGIPFVILSGHKIHHRNAGFAAAQLRMRRTISTFVKASQIGISWVTKTYENGVFLVGNEDASYNSHLFSEVKNTQLLSSWPTVFDPRYRFSLSSPLLHPTKQTIKGYFFGGVVKMVDIPLEYASFAVNVKLGKELQRKNDLWKLTFDKLFTSTELGLRAYHIQPLANKCTDIYVWKLNTAFTHVTVVNTQKIPLKVKWLGTNVRHLHKLIVKWFATDIHGSSFEF